MIGLAQLLSRQFDDVDASNVSSICIRTAQPKYLVFTDTATHPRFVVQFGQYAPLRKVFDHLTELHALLPARVPRPLFISEDIGAQSVFVQEGLPGRPWFSLKSVLTGPQSWLTLRARVFNVLAEFHETVSSQQQWCRDIALWQVLEKTALQYKALAGVSGDNFDQMVNAHVELLRPLEEITCFNQHGDFCINNMLLNDESTGIIDFEHFGVVQTPFHDEWLLVDSLMDFAPTSCVEFGEETWSMAVSQSPYAQIIGENALPALLLQFYLWWGIETANQPLRARKSAFYTLCIETFSHIYQTGGRWQDAYPWVVAKQSA